jgi:hypothetical protein
MSKVQISTTAYKMWGLNFLLLQRLAITNRDHPINNRPLRLFIFNLIKFDLNHLIYHEQMRSITTSISLFMLLQTI